MPEEIKTASNVCLNCKTPLSDRFCSHCGQDSKEYKKSVWQLFFQFLETFTDFDNKLWRTLFPLLFRPGFLTREFLEGKRKSFLNPVQMYAFFSFVFFLTAFYLPNLYPEHETAAEDFISGMKEGIAGSKDKKDKGVQQREITFHSDSLLSGWDDAAEEDSVEKSKPVAADKPKPKKSEGKKSGFEFSGLPETVVLYDSIQKTLAEKDRDGFFKNRLKRKLISLNERFEKEDESALSSFIDTFKGNIPNIIILLLPLAALGLKILYFRKGWFYIEHLIFAIHFHCFAFLVLSIYNLIGMIMPDENWSDVVTFLSILLYALFSLRYMFQQSWIRTFFKFSLLTLFYSLLLVAGLLLNLVAAALLMA